MKSFKECTWRIKLGRYISPKFFRPKFFHGRLHGMSVPRCLYFPGLGGSDRSFCLDVPPKTSSLGWFFVSDKRCKEHVWDVFGEPGWGLPSSRPFLIFSCFSGLLLPPCIPEQVCKITSMAPSLSRYMASPYPISRVALLLSPLCSPPKAMPVLICLP